jgi:hypothetical protein
VLIGENTTIRNLTVANLGAAGGDSNGITLTANTAHDIVLNDLTVVVGDTANNIVGIFGSDVSPIIERVTVVAESTDCDGRGRGIELFDGTPTLREVTVGDWRGWFGLRRSHRFCDRDDQPLAPHRSQQREQLRDVDQQRLRARHRLVTHASGGAIGYGYYDLNAALQFDGVTISAAGSTTSSALVVSVRRYSFATPFVGDATSLAAGTSTVNVANSRLVAPFPARPSPVPSSSTSPPWPPRARPAPEESDPMSRSISRTRWAAAGPRRAWAPASLGSPAPTARHHFVRTDRAVPADGYSRSLQHRPEEHPLGAAATYTATVWGANGDCDIPTSATGVSLNVTAINPTRAASSPCSPRMPADRRHRTSTTPPASRPRPTQ